MKLTRLLLLTIVLILVSLSFSKENTMKDDSAMRWDHKHLLEKLAQLLYCDDHFVTAKANTSPAPSKNMYTQAHTDKIKASLNHRSEAMNPNSKRFNPTSQMGSNGKTSRKSSREARAKNEQMAKNKQSDLGLRASKMLYGPIAIFVQIYVETCLLESNFTAGCSREAAVEAGFAMSIAIILSRIPYVNYIPLIRSAYCHCKKIMNTDYEFDQEASLDCAVHMAKLVSAIGITKVSFSIPIVGPIVDGTATALSNKFWDWTREQLINYNCRQILKDELLLDAFDLLPILTRNNLCGFFIFRDLIDNLAKSNLD